ncbi:MAG: dihydrodipicolinate synthase family protein [Limnobacter sp.]|uniref:dihydrodipicolinate synthase family protein n=1 Tax=Limnobacter sp. TaxID=2003368 RepID=UPI00391A258E
MTRLARFNGVWVPLITPIKNKNIDLKSLTRLLEWILDYPVQGVIVGGCCAERLLLTDHEVERLVSTTLSVVGQRCKVITSIGSQSTAKAIESIRFHAQQPVDGLMVSVPSFYTQPNESELLGHFEALCQASPLPLIIDNDAQRRGFGLDLAQLNLLSESTRQSSNQFRTLRAVRHTLRDGEDWATLLANSPLDVLCGDDSQLPSFLQQGGQAIASAAAQLAPGLVCRMHSQEGKLSNPDRMLFDRCLHMLGGDSVIGALKYHLSELGLVSNELRMPLQPLSHNEAWTSAIAPPAEPKIQAEAR